MNKLKQADVLGDQSVSSYRNSLFAHDYEAASDCNSHTKGINTAGDAFLITATQR